MLGFSREKIWDRLGTEILIIWESHKCINRKGETQTSVVTENIAVFHNNMLEDNSLRQKN